LSRSFELEEIGKQSPFIPRYRNDCPRTPYSDLTGFVGVLKFSGVMVPVFELFVRDINLKRKVVIADGPRMGRWLQRQPIDEPNDAHEVEDWVLIRVDDLNKTDELRAKIIAENPDWLKDRPDKDRYLRTHVVVNIYEKISFEVSQGATRVIDVSNRRRLRVRRPLSPNVPPGH